MCFNVETVLHSIYISKGQYVFYSYCWVSILASCGEDRVYASLCAVRVRCLQNSSIPHSTRVVTKTQFSFSLLESQYLRGKCWWKGKFALFRKPATGGKWLTDVQRPFLIPGERVRFLKGKFKRGDHIQLMKRAGKFMTIHEERWSTDIGQTYV